MENRFIDDFMSEADHIREMTTEFNKIISDMESYFNPDALNQGDINDLKRIAIAIEQAIIVAHDVLID